MELSPIPERINQLRQLTQQYGDHSVIPVEDLEQIGYVRRFDEETDTTRLLPIELLGTIATKEMVVDKKAQMHEIPFSDSTVRLDTALQYGSTLEGFIVRHRLTRLVGVLEYGSYSADYFIEWLYGKNMLYIIDEIQHTAYVREKGQIYSIGFGDMESEALGVIEKLYEEPTLTTRDSRLTDSADLIHLLDLDERDAVYDATKAEILVERLERIRGVLNDLPEIEKRFYHGFAELYIKDDRYSGTFTENDTGDNPIYDLSTMSQTEVFTARMQPIGAFLRSIGFQDVAERAVDVQSIEELKSVIMAGVSDNEMAKKYKDREKTMRTSRRSMSDEAQIRQFARDLSALKAEQKAAMRPLHDLYNYLDMPKHFCRAVNNRIVEAQKMFVHGGQATGAVELRMDATPDPQKDTDPGKISGDCTAGNSIQFDPRQGSFNVKLYLDDEHRGNAYLVETTDKNGKSVWHFDAIQLPALHIDWDTFPEYFIAAIGRQAQAKGIDMITINREPFAISNYDYISRGFLKYLGAENTDSIQYEQMEQPNNHDLTVDQAIERTSVILPAAADGHSGFQGGAHGQYVIWKKH